MVIIKLYELRHLKLSLGPLQGGRGGVERRCIPSRKYRPKNSNIHIHHHQYQMSIRSGVVYKRALEGRGEVIFWGATGIAGVLLKCISGLLWAILRYRRSHGMNHKLHVLSRGSNSISNHLHDVVFQHLHHYEEVHVVVFLTSCSSNISFIICCLSFSENESQGPFKIMFSPIKKYCLFMIYLNKLLK
jgi:hypothetical protein